MVPPMVRDARQSSVPSVQVLIALSPGVRAHVSSQLNGEFWLAGSSLWTGSQVMALGCV